ncbi:hypothetical protein [Mycobacterium sp. URHB0021]
MTTTLTTNPSTNTADILATARQDIHNAVGADDDQRRRQYALSARDNAVTVLLDPSSTRREREYAEYYLADAQGIIANTDQA